MSNSTDDLRIRDIKELSTPEELMREYVRGERASATVAGTRRTLHRILHGQEDRLAVVIGPCSIHDVKAAREYARRLKVAARPLLAHSLEIVMRVYFEKPRTTVGWKGLINDPDLDGSFHIDKGLRLARGLLLDINELGVPAGCEFLDMITPQYIGDLVAWGAIGARTTESQVHRELASGVSCPVGFKNGTDGNVKIAIDAVQAASYPHRFLAVTKQGRSAIATTAGNTDCHVILRGGKTPNYDAPSVDAACTSIAAAGLATRIMIDASHANSGKRHERQSAGDRGCRTADRGGRAAHRRRDGGEPSRRGTAGSRGGRPARLWSEYHRCVYRLGHVRRFARTPCDRCRAKARVACRHRVIAGWPP